MSEEENQFTLEDAENDGRIKKEAGSIMMRTAQRHSPDLYKAFMDVCEDKGLEPNLVFGDALVRALNSEDYANIILNTEVDKSVLNRNNMRMEDVQFVEQIADVLDLKPDQTKDPIDRLIERRIDNTANAGMGPFGRMMDEDENGDVDDIMREDTEKKELRREVRELKNEVRRLSDQTREDVNVEERVEQETRKRKSIDELFDDEEDSDEGEEENDDVEEEDDGNDIGINLEVGKDITEDDGVESVDVEEDEPLEIEDVVRDDDSDGLGGLDIEMDRTPEEEEEDD